MGFPTKNDHFGVFWGYHHLRKHPYHFHSSILHTIFFGGRHKFDLKNPKVMKFGYDVFDCFAGETSLWHTNPERKKRRNLPTKSCWLISILKLIYGESPILGYCVCDT